MIRLIFALYLGLIGAAHAQLAGGLQFPGPGTPHSAGAAFSLTYQSSGQVNNTVGTSLNFGTMTYGASSSAIVAAIAFADNGSANINITAVTVNGTSLAPVAGSIENTGSGNGARTEIWMSSGTISGSSGNVTVTQSAVGTNIATVALYNLVTTTLTPSVVRIAGTAFGTSATSSAMTIPSGGGAILANYMQNGSAPSAAPTGTTLDAAVNLFANFYHYTGTGSVTPSISTGANDGIAISAVAWGP